jgi:hypothetical protein
MDTHHRDGHNRSTAHQHLLATKAVDNEVHGNDDTDQADDAVDTVA